MRTIYRVVLLTALATSALGLAGCSSGFDPTSSTYSVSTKRKNFPASARTCFPAAFRE